MVTIRGIEVLRPALSVLLAALVLVAGFSGPGLAGPPPREQINIMYFAIPLSLSEIAAKKRGFFEKHGLDVQLVAATSGADALKFIVAGSAYGQLGSNALNLQAIDAGQPLVELGSIANVNPIEIIARTDVGLPFDGDLKQKVAALRGKTIGVTGIGAATYLVAKGLLLAGGMSNPDNEVHFVAVGLVLTALEQLKAKRIDAYAFLPPFGPMAEAAGAGRKYIGREQFPSNMQPAAWLTITTTREQVTKRPGVAKAWCAAEREGLEWVTNPANFKAAVQLMREEFLSNQPPGVVEATTKFYTEVFFKSAESDLRVPLKAYANDLGLIKDIGLQGKGSLKYEDVVLNLCR